MINPMRKVFFRWGRQVAVCHGGYRRNTKALLQHISSVSRQSRKQEYSPLGEVPVGAYLLLALPEDGISAGDIVEADGAVYKVKRAELFYAGDLPLYIWGLCEKEGSGKPWGS